MFYFPLLCGKNLFFLLYFWVQFYVTSKALTHLHKFCYILFLFYFFKKKKRNLLSFLFKQLVPLLYSLTCYFFNSVYITRYNICCTKLFFILFWVYKESFESCTKLEHTQHHRNFITEKLNK